MQLQLLGNNGNSTRYIMLLNTKFAMLNSLRTPSKLFLLIGQSIAATKNICVQWPIRHRARKTTAGNKYTRPNENSNARG